MAEIVLKHVQKVYPNTESKKKGFFGKKKKTEEKKHNLKVTEDGVLAVEDFNLTVHDQEFVVLVGPSGCGKSTTMRMVAGLEDITSGDVLIDGKRVNDVAPKDRDIAMVFQSYALYPNMTVYENMAFTLELKKVPKDEIDRKVRSAAEILGITEYLDRKPKALSGGQRQRVAIGRAIVRDPKEVFNHPANIFVAGFIGVPQMNFFDAQLVRSGNGFTVKTEDMNVALAPETCAQLALNWDGGDVKEITAGVRPEQILLADKDEEGALQGTVEVTELMGSTEHVHVTAPDGQFVLIIPVVDLEAKGALKAGDTIWFKFEKNATHLFDKVSGKNLI